ncbi:hypothetical protein Tco_0712425, partial [Tanacetum coccineum]
CKSHQSLSPTSSVNRDKLNATYDSDILSEVPHYDTYHETGMLNHVVQETEYSEHLVSNNDSYDELTSNNNVISYAEYIVTIENDDAQSVPPLKQDNAMILFVIEQMQIQVERCNAAKVSGFTSVGNKSSSRVNTAKIRMQRDKYRIIDQGLGSTEPPLGEGNTSRSGEGSMQLLELINLYTKLSDKVTSLEDELASTKAIYNKALITLTKRVKKLEKQLNHKKRRAVIDSSKDEGPRKSHDTAEHRMESEHDDDDRTLAETLLNIKRSAAKGKAIMQESEPPKKIKKKEMIQISLDEEFAKSFYEEEQAQILQDEVYAKQVEAQWIADEERIPQEAKQTDEREKVINWNDPDVLRYHAVQNRPFSKAEVRKNMCTYLKNQGGYKMSHFKGMSYEDIRPIFERVWDQNQAFVPKDSEIEKEVMKRPGFDLQQESSKKTGGSRKKTLARKRAGEKQSKEGAKRQKTEYEKEKEELKA